jgi:hypothetical protein
MTITVGIIVGKLVVINLHSVSAYSVFCLLSYFTFLHISHVLK